MARLGMVDGLTLAVLTGGFQCSNCVQGKQARRFFNKVSQRKAKHPLDLVHTDVCGPFRTQALDGSKYYLLFVDDKTRYVHAYPIREKSQVFGKFREYKAAVESHHGRKIKILRSDNGGEYTSDAFKAYCVEHGIEQQFTPPRTPQCNGVAKWYNRTLVECMRTNLLASGLPRRFWAAALRYAVHVKNRLWTKRLGSISPFEAWTGAKPKVDEMRTFGCKAYALLDPQNREKLEKKSKLVVYLGPRPGASMGHVVYDPTTCRIEATRDLVFFEQEHVQVDGEDVSVPIPTGVQAIPIFQEWCIGTCTAVEAIPQEPVEDRMEEPNPAIPDDVPIDVLIAPPLPPPPAAAPINNDPPNNNPPGNWDAVVQQLRQRFTGQNPVPGAYQSLVPTHPPVAVGSHSLRHRVPRNYTEPDTTDEEVEHAVFMAAEKEKTGSLPPPPETLKEAQNRPDWNEWLKAILEELTSIHGLGTYSLVKRQPRMNVLRNKWVFTYKLDTSGQIERYKARLVVKGFAQRYGIDYNETFSPTARMKSIKVLLAIAAVEDLEAVHMDVSTAFLNGTLKEKVYMEQPEGFEDGTSKVCHLHRTLYGLKQSPREWYNNVNQTMQDMGFTSTAHDPSVFLKWCDDQPIYIGVYVDDMLVVSPNREWIDAVYALLSKHYKLKNLGDVEKMLGMRIHRNRAQRKLFIDQELYVKDILAKYEFDQLAPSPIPTSSSVKLQTDSPGDPLLPANKPYREAVGSFMYAMQATRPDISFAVGLVS